MHSAIPATRYAILLAQSARISPASGRLLCGEADSTSGTDASSGSFRLGSIGAGEPDFPRFRAKLAKSLIKMIFNGEITNN